MTIIFILLATLNITSLMLLLIALVSIGVSDMKMIREDIRVITWSSLTCLITMLFMYLLL
jgi:hypothetical protein